MEHFSPEERLQYLRRHGGHCLAYSTLQPGMSFFDVPSLGYLAYVVYGGTYFVLSDPVCSSLSRQALVSSFLDLAPNAFFVQVSDDIASLLHDTFGFRVNSLGVENSVELRPFHVSWSVRRDLKRWVSSLKKRGMTVSHEPHTIGSNEITRVSHEWLQSKAVKREMSFLTRPFQEKREPAVRHFYAMYDKKLAGFCTFDPCYRNGKVIAFALNHMRRLPDAPNGTIDYTVMHAIRQFEQEGIQTMELGLSPLHDRSTGKYRGAVAADAIADLLYTQGSRFYRFRQLGFHKDRYRPEKRQVYVASRKRFIAWDVFKLLKLMGVL